MRQKQWEEGSPGGVGLGSALMRLRLSPSKLKSKPTPEVSYKPSFKVGQVTVFTGALRGERNFLERNHTHRVDNFRN